MKTVKLLLVVAVVASLVAGCIQPMPAEEAQQEVETAESALCASIEAYAASVAALEAVTPETTVAELDALKAAEADAYATMVDSWADLQEAEVQAVESAVAEFQASLKEITPDETLGEISADIQASAATVAAAVDQLDQTACAPTP